MRTFYLFFSVLISVFHHLNGNYFPSKNHSNQTNIIKYNQLNEAKYVLVVGSKKESGDISVDEIIKIDSIYIESYYKTGNKELIHIKSFQVGYIPNVGSFEGHEMNGSILPQSVKTLFAKAKRGDKFIFANIKVSDPKCLVSTLTLRIK